MFVHSRRDGQHVWVEDDVFGGEAHFVHEDPVGPLTDADFVFEGRGLSLFVKGHHDGCGAVAEDRAGTFAKQLLDLLAAPAPPGPGVPASGGEPGALRAVVDATGDFWWEGELRVPGIAASGEAAPSALSEAEGSETEEDESEEDGDEAEEEDESEEDGDKAEEEEEEVDTSGNGSASPGCRIAKLEFKHARSG